MAKILIKKEDAISDRFPPNCMICGDGEATSFEMLTFSSPHYPPWVYLGCILGLPGLLLAAIIGSFYRKKHSVNVKLCDQCYQQYKRMPIWTTIIVASCILLFVVMLISFGNDQHALGVISLFLCFLVPIVAYFLFYRKYSITCAYIDDRYIALNIPAEMYADIYNDYICSHPSMPPQYSRQNVAYCNSCGYPNKIGGKFCVKCGQPLV